MGESQLQIPATWPEEFEERLRFIAALREGIKDLEEGNVRPAEDVFRDLSAKYDLGLGKS